MAEPIIDSRTLTGIPVRTNAMLRQQKGKGPASMDENQPVDSYSPSAARQKANQQFQEMSSTYQEQMTNYLQEIHAHTLPGILKGLSGDVNNAADTGKLAWDSLQGATKYLWDEPRALMGNRNAEADAGSDFDAAKNDATMPGGCQDLQERSGEILKPLVEQPGSKWEARNIKITMMDSSWSPVQHNAVLVYPKGGNPKEGYVFDPWKNQEADPPVPLEKWQEEFPELPFVFMGQPGDIGNQSSGQFERFSNYDLNPAGGWEK